MNFTTRDWNSAFLLFFAIAIIPAFQNCDIRQPRVEDLSSQAVGFAHSGNEDSCVSCHETDRPLPLGGQPHGGGGDCVNCHSPMSPWNQVKAGAFSHNPVPTSCNSCHAQARPTVLVGNPPFNHSVSGTGDCLGCHSAGAGVSWKSIGGNFSHNPVPVSCNACHLSVRPTVARYPGNQTVNGHYTSKDCVSCHRPKDTTVTTFDFNHSNAANQDIKFCLPCHTRDAHVGQDGSVPADAVGDGLCYQCHYVRRRSWADGPRDQSRFP